MLDQLQASGVRRVRLDAVGYAVKTPGLTSFMTPETFQFIDQITAWCHQRGMEVLVEVHSYYQFQVEIARQVDQVYDFALPPLILHALTAGDADPLLAWMDVRPPNTLTVLDTHDGIGIIDVGAEASDNSRPGLLTADQIDRLVATISDNSGGTSRRATGASNRDLYQVNCTFYDALGADDARYLLARALQLWTPGRPQIYYVGLLAGSNDLELPARSRVDRDVNRHHYTASEIDAALLRPVVQQLCSLIRFRNTHPAFDGEFRISSGVGQLSLTWTAGEERATLAADLTMAAATVQWTDNGRTREAPLAEL